MGSLRRRLRGEGLPAHQQRRQERQRPVLGLRSQDVHAIRPQLQHLRLPQDQRRDGSGASSGELLRVARLVLGALTLLLSNSREDVGLDVASGTERSLGSSVGYLWSSQGTRGSVRWVPGRCRSLVGCCSVLCFFVRPRAGSVLCARAGRILGNIALTTSSAQRAATSEPPKHQVQIIVNWMLIPSVSDAVRASSSTVNPPMSCC